MKVSVCDPWLVFLRSQNVGQIFSTIAHVCARACIREQESGVVTQHVVEV